jgi:hypothetical protein
MTSLHGGCDPFGMVAAPQRRGRQTVVMVSRPGALLLESVRSPEKRAVMTATQEDFGEEAARRAIPVEIGPVTRDRLLAEIDAGDVAIVPISRYRIVPRADTAPGPGARRRRQPSLRARSVTEGGRARDDVDGTQGVGVRCLDGPLSEFQAEALQRADPLV